MPTYKDINLLTQKAAVAGTEKLPVSDTEFITPDQITESLNAQLDGGDGEIRKNYSWSNGYVASSVVISSSLSQFCQPVLFHKGEKLRYKAGSTYSSAVVQVADNTPIAVGSRGFALQVLINAMVANVQYEYTFPSDMWVVISVYIESYELHVTLSESNSLSARVSALEYQVGDIETILASI